MLTKQYKYTYIVRCIVSKINFKSVNNTLKKYRQFLNKIKNIRYKNFKNSLELLKCNILLRYYVGSSKLFLFAYKKLILPLYTMCTTLTNLTTPTKKNS